MMLNIRRSVIIASGLFGTLALSLLSVPASAATGTASFGLAATVQATCLITAPDLSFGTYTGSAVTATSNISVTCTDTTPYNVGLDAGVGSGATTTTRTMSAAGTTDVLKYALASLSASGSNWGNVVGTDTETGTGTGLAQTLTVYGSVAANQYIAPAAYTDTVTATITY